VKHPVRLSMTMLHLAVLLICAAATAAAAPTQSRPNVLMISLDDLNDWVGCLGGHPQSFTPHIDRLAARGTLFTNAHCPSPKCAPSRAAILTGRRPWNTGIYDNDQWWKPHLPDVITLPQRFKWHGYYVAGAGKVHHHTAGNNPPDQWDEFFPQVFDGPWALTNRLNYPYVPDAEAPAGFPFSRIGSGEFDWGVPPQPETKFGDVLATDWIIERLRERREVPWFLALGIYRPHMPLYAPRRWFDRFPLEEVALPAMQADDLDDVPAAGRKLVDPGNQFRKIQAAGKLPEAVRAYLACIAFADAQVGRVLDALDASGQAERTVVVLWSDHGFHLGEKGHFFKQTLWQRSTQVPLIVAGGGASPAGARCDRPVNLIDLYPTLLELCRLTPDSEADGVSLVPLLRDATAAWDRPSIVSWRRGNYAVIDEAHHYIRYEDGSQELYDRRGDPRQERNLAGRPEHAETIERLAAWIPASEDPPAPGKSAYRFDPEKYTWTRTGAAPPREAR
jgi:arylsulfatase A-like enzyme